MFPRLFCIAAVVTLLSTFAVAGTDPDDAIHIDGPISSGNLAIYLVHGPNLVRDRKYLTLSEGLEQQRAVIRDSRSTNELTAENDSDRDLFLQGGEIFKGGDQDRVASRDRILPPQSGEVSILVNCVEHGRSSARGSERSDVFDASLNILACKSLRRANFGLNQQNVWNNVELVQAKILANSGGMSDEAAVSPTSFELTVEGKSVQAAVAGYMKEIKADAEITPDTIGFFFTINGTLNSGDVYGSADLFQKMYPKLLRAAAVEALAERRPAWLTTVYRTPAPEAITVMMKMVNNGKSEPLAQDTAAAERQQMGAKSPSHQSGYLSATAGTNFLGGDRADLVKKESAGCVMYESRDTLTNAAFLHRVYLTK